MIDALRPSGNLEFINQKLEEELFREILGKVDLEYLKPSRHKFSDRSRSDLISILWNYSLEAAWPDGIPLKTVKVKLDSLISHLRSSVEGLEMFLGGEAAPEPTGLDPSPGAIRDLFDIWDDGRRKLADQEVLREVRTILAVAQDTAAWLASKNTVLELVDRRVIRTRSTAWCRMVMAVNEWAFDHGYPRGKSGNVEDHNLRPFMKLVEEITLTVGGPSPSVAAPSSLNENILKALRGEKL